MLFDPDRHQKLADDAWSESRALATAAAIFNDLCARREDGGLWPAHPDEDSTLRFNKSLYMGSAGTIWGLVELGARLGLSLPFDPKELAKLTDDLYLSEPDTDSVVPSLLLGETGILLLQKKLSPSDELRAKLRAHIVANTSNPVNEALWGCPGTMLAALQIGDVDLFRAGAQYLFDSLKRAPDDSEKSIWIWYQDLYGKTSRYIGAGHGFFGNVQALLEGQAHLDEAQRQSLLEKTVETALTSARRADGLANWMPGFFMDNDPRPPLTQWCHGSPGVITSLRSFPKGYSAELEKLLVEAGELVWTAGPLKKGIGICHGTDGNGYALLRMFARTGDEMWLDRARRFAMHAIHQRNGRSTLWTGEVGLALFLVACVDARADFPILDYF